MLLNPDDVASVGFVTNNIVESVLTQYTACSFRPSDANQFTIIAAFVLRATGHPDTASELALHPLTKVVALATGAKCQPTASFSPTGDALHDSHAEVLARRAFRRWLTEELQRALKANSASYWLQQSIDSAKWTFREDAEIYMYISAVPCAYLFTLHLDLSDVRHRW